MYKVWLGHRWLENVPVLEAVVFKEEGYKVERMDSEAPPPLNTHKSWTPDEVWRETS